MADMEFDLGEALGSYEQAKADRDFYLSMVQGGTQVASPIAAYLYGVSNVKMANQRAKVQNIEDQRQAEKDAIAATEKAQKRESDLYNQLGTLVKGVRDGSIAPSVGATMVGPLAKELGITLKQYDAARGVIVGRQAGDTEDFEWDWSESPTSKLQQNYYKTQNQIALQQQREDRLAKQAETKRKLDEQKLEDLRKGKSSTRSSADETRFINENKDLFENVFNPKSALLKRVALEDRLMRYVGDDTRILQKWLRGVRTLSEDAQERLGEYTDLIETKLNQLNNPKGASLVSNEPTTRSTGTKAF